MTSLYSMAGTSGGGGSGPDLTAPIPPVPVSLASGTTALGSTSIGSWSASVTVKRGKPTKLKPFPVHPAAIGGT